MGGVPKSYQGSHTWVTFTLFSVGAGTILEHREGAGASEEDVIAELNKTQELACFALRKRHVPPAEPRFLIPIFPVERAVT
ncbi:hypothetical protein BaRGS_00022318 [Batillaria attramentaria]|uniref:Uncharacterized protein n=1 Tax=Batillaria attramentaria TaxID=370345 RepID=A0ABD0KGW2_9CAEN